MRIKRLYLLLIFIFSILITNLHYSDLKPPLLDKNTTKNLVILADSVAGGSGENLIPTDLSDHDHSFVVSDNYKSFVPMLVFITLIISKLEIEVVRYFKLERIRGLYGIVLWDRKRLMLN